MIRAAPAMRAPCTIDWPMPPETHDQHGGAGGYVGGVEDGPDTGLDGTADQADQIEGGVVVQLDHGVGRRRRPSR